MKTYHPLDFCIAPEGRKEVGRRTLGDGSVLRLEAYEDGSGCRLQLLSNGMLHNHSVADSLIARVYFNGIATKDEYVRVFDKSGRYSETIK